MTDVNNNKIALCFIINDELMKEDLWIQWINENSQIINVYFYFKDYNKIKSDWIKKYVIPKDKIVSTTYLNVIPAYVGLMNYAFINDINNKWFCMLTESCCPIISPKKFKELFILNSNKSVFSWKKAWWNPLFHKRSNLRYLNKKFWLANDPWFTLTRKHVQQVLNFVCSNVKITKKITEGGLANESLFAIILAMNNELFTDNIINSPTHIVDWSRMTSATSPHLFVLGNDIDLKFIKNELDRNSNVMFIRKISKKFPTYILKKIIGT